MDMFSTFGVILTVVCTISILYNLANYHAILSHYGKVRLKPAFWIEMVLDVGGLLLGILFLVWA